MADKILESMLAQARFDMGMVLAQRNRLGQALVNAQLNAGRAIAILEAARFVSPAARLLADQVINELRKSPFPDDTEANGHDAKGPG